MKTETANRKLKISILSFNPQEPGSVPRMQTYEIDEAENMTLFIALMEIREKQDPSLQFDFVCRAGICGSCGMMINGSPTLACRTLTKDLGTEISLAPLPVFELIGDLFGLGSYATVRYVLVLQKRLLEHGASLWLIALQPILTIAIITAVAVTGTWLPFALYWVVPIATWLTLILRLRSIAEHYALPHDRVLNCTRTVLPTFLEKLFVAPKGIALHLEHHQYPSVPFFRLPALHAALMEQADFREQSHLTDGYTGVLRECLQFTNTRPPRA